MGEDLRSEVRRLLERGRSPSEIRVSLEERGFGRDAVEQELSTHVSSSGSRHKRNSFIFAFRDVLDRVGYGTSALQFVNILLWLAWQSSPYIIFIVGLLNGAKTLLSIVWSNIMQEYNKLHQFSRKTISYAGILYGFSFILLAAALLMHNIWLFAFGFLAGTVGIVAYGDLYQQFVHDVLRREHMGAFLRGMAHWGVLITAAALLFSGWLLDAYPMDGVPVTILGRQMTGYGFLYMFEITAFSFILSGYVTSFVVGSRDKRTYGFRRFVREYARLLRTETRAFLSNSHVLLLTSASVISGLLQILLTAYVGIAIYRHFADVYTMPFFALGVVYAIAIIASFTGPFFTQKIHRSTGLAPTLVFGTLLMAILPLILVYKMDIVTITIALSLNVVGSSITGFAQGMLARKLLPDETRTSYFRVQSLMVILPYAILIPLLSWVANAYPLAVTFHIITVGLVFVVMPLYFFLVVLSQRQRL